MGMIALSIFDNQEYIYKMLRAGTNSYLLKDSSVQEITKAIQIAHQGDYYFHPIASLGNPVNYNDVKAEPCFTQREKEILYLVLKEHSYFNIFYCMYKNRN